ncbi:hypothetical protein [Niallia sp. 03133]|uniref:hypothetical protein n=1 Tax=Niallia sp. 03133 TaxID=3458060 RepID=UPI00404471E2
MSSSRDWDIDSRDWFYKDKRYVGETINQLKNLGHHRPVIFYCMIDKPQLTPWACCCNTCIKKAMNVKP